MIRSLLFRFAPLLLAIAAFVGAAPRVGPWLAFAGWLVIWALLTLGGAACLHHFGGPQPSTISLIASIPLRWGYSFTRGKLWQIALASWIGWALIGLGLALSTGRSVPSTSGLTAPAAAGEGVSIVVFASWLLNAVVLLYFISTYVRHFRGSPSAGRSLLGPVLFLFVLLISSIGLHLRGHSNIAAIIGAGPVVIVGLGYAAMVAVMVLFGRHGDWR